MKRTIISLLLFTITNLLYSSNISIVPAYGNNGELMTVNIKMLDFKFTNENNKVIFLYRRLPTEFISVGKITKIDSLNIKADIIIGNEVYTGNYSVLLINGNNDSLICINSFMVYGKNHGIVGIIPNISPPNTDLKITIIGTKTHFKSNTPSFTFNSVANSGFYEIHVNSINVINDSVCEAQIYVEEVIKGELPVYFDMEYFMPSEFTDIYNAFQVTFHTNVKEQSLVNDKFSIYPIPFSQKFNINSEEHINSISIYNLKSQLEFQSINPMSNNGTYTFNDIVLLKGIYYIKIETEKGTEIRKVLSY